MKYIAWRRPEKRRNDAWRAIVKNLHDAKAICIQEGFSCWEPFQRVTTQLAGAASISFDD